MNIRMIGFLFLFIFSLTIASPYFMLAAQTTQGLTEIKNYIANDKQKMEKTDLIIYEESIYEVTKIFVNNGNRIEDKLVEAEINRYLTSINGYSTYNQIITNNNIDENKLLSQSEKMNLTKNDLISATSFSENSDFTPTKGAKLEWTPFLVWAAKLLAGWLFTKLANYGTYKFCRYYNDYNWASDKVCDVGSPAHRD